MGKANRGKLRPPPAATPGLWVRPTLAAVARHADCSIGLVSTVLNNSSNNIGASEDTRRRIVEAAKQLNYRPNAAARAQRSRRFNTIALVSRHDIGTIHINLLKGVASELADTEQHLLLSFLPNPQADEILPPRLFRELAVDGMLVHHAWSIDHKMITVIRNQGIPVVWINTKDPQDCVYPDDYGAARHATHLLLGRGHRRIAALCIDPELARHYSHLDRASGFSDAMMEAGLPQRTICFDHRGARAEEHYETVLKLLSTTRERPTALLALDHHLHLPVIRAADKLKLSIPRDFSMIALSNLDRKIECGQVLSTLTVPIQTVGRDAVRLLQKKIREGNEPAPSHAIPYEPVNADTLAPPPP
jgi:DNA-binding LacI/PurR family transcriptional regulator